MNPQPKKKRIKLSKDEYTDDQIARIGCIVCRRAGYYSPATIHHIRKLLTSKKRKLAPRIPLCPMHHQTGGYGLALHDGEKAFETNFGSVLDMLDEVNSLLRLVI